MFPQIPRGSKILLLTSTFPRYQGDREYSTPFLLNLCHEYLRYGLEVVVLAPHERGIKHNNSINGIKVRHFQYLPARIERLAYGWGILPNINKNRWLILEVPFFLISEFIKAATIIKREKIDVIHAHWVFPQAFVAVLLKKILRIPVLATAHGGDVFGLKRGIFRKIIKFTLRNVDYCTVNSSATLKAAETYHKRNFQIIPMGVDIQKFSNVKIRENIRDKYRIDDILLIFVGRLTEKKGVKYLIQAMAKVKIRYPEAKMLIIGHGGLKDDLIHLSKRLNVDESVIWLGAVANDLIPNYLASADIFIGPSIIAESGDTEGLGVVFLEALAAGCAVVASNVGGISDVIIHEKTGLLVEQKNPDQIVEAIIRLIEDGDLRKRLIENSRQHVEDNFGWDKIGKKFSDLILRVSRE